MNTQPPPLPKTTSFWHQAAKLSWVCPIIIWVMLAASRQIGSPVLKDLLALFLILVGLLFGLIALFGIPKQGAKGILAPALIGIILNGLLLFAFVMNFMAARIRAMQQHTSIEDLPALVVSSNTSPNPTPTPEKLA